MKNFLLFAMLMLVLTSQAQKKMNLFSPDSSLFVQFTVGNGISYQLFAGGRELTGLSSLDITLGNGLRLADKAKVRSSRISSHDLLLDVPVPYRKKQVRDRYRQMDIQFVSGFSLQVRMYDGGFSYRIGLAPGDSITVVNEEAVFAVNNEADIWMAPMNRNPDRDRFHTSFEGVYRKYVLKDVADTALTYAPLTVSLKNGYHLSISDVNLVDYPGMFLQKDPGGLRAVFAPFPLAEQLSGGEFPQQVVTSRAGYIARVAGSRMLPWRAVMIARHERELPVNDLFYVLGEPAQGNFSWVRPAKGTDEWITGINLFNVPFVAGLNTATYKYYIDFAARFGFDQIMLDAGWSEYLDLTRHNSNMDMDEIVRYAREKKVNLMLWTLCTTLDRQLDTAMAMFRKWGISSIMTDFMDRDDQKMVNFYHRVARACAENRIAVMFHGAFPPKGMNRTWPNVVAHEGVLGAEWNIWSDLPQPEHNVALAFTRMLAGPMDYEPGLLVNAQRAQFRPGGTNPMSMGTRTNQLAMFLVYDSPVQIFSGNISQGMLEPAFMQFLGSFPTTWDETRILDGRIGEFIITARRKGTTWYVAGLNNETPRELTISLSDLPGAGGKATFCIDGLNAHRYASDHILGDTTVSGSFKVRMAPAGGFVYRLD